jgi:uncharacterized membrane protein
MRSKNGIVVAIAVVAVAALVAVGWSLQRREQVVAVNVPAVGSPGHPAESASPDLVIPVASVTGRPAFYSTRVDGTELEVIAVRTSDGALRTAFNTCQICYSSGRGYYKQVGGYLVCQNCGNRFGMDQLGVAAGGCNPVPIFPEDRVTDGTNIIIPREYLAQAKALFASWKY